MLIVWKDLYPDTQEKSKYQQLKNFKKQDHIQRKKLIMEGRKDLS